MAGTFVVLEGVDGGGKSTQARRLVERLRAAGRDVLHLREPGATALGEKVREVLLDPATGHVAPIAEVFLYQAARAQMVAEVLRPALAAGRAVVCERWHPSTSAYQGVAGGAGLEAVRATSALATGGLEPDRVLLLDLPDDLANARLGPHLDRIEGRGEAYRAEVAAALRDLFRAGGPTYRVVSALGSPEEVGARVWEAVHDLFGA